MKRFISGFLLILLGVVVFVVGDFYSARYFKSIMDERSNWPIALGTVLDSSVKGDGDEVPFYVKVKFTYRVDGTNYSGEPAWNVRDGALNALINQAPKTHEEQRLYSPGKIVTVYYDPMNPAKAKVQPRGEDLWWSWVTRIQFGVVAIVVLIGGSMIVQQVRQKDPK